MIDGSWSGDSWRWGIRAHAGFRPSIAVIEPTEKPEDKPTGSVRKVPFGFGPRDPELEPEPQLWEGAD